MFPVLRKTIIPVTNWLFNPVIVHPENMPLTGPCFIFGNHSNHFDAFLINAKMTQEPTAGVMTREQFHKTLPRIAMDSIGIVPTSKYIPEPGIVRNVFRMIDQQRMIVIFPEGGRRWDGRPKPFIESTLKLFWKMKIPVHPVRILGSYLGWPRWADWPRKSRMELHFLKPMHPGNFSDYETFAETCRSSVHFGEYDPPPATFPYTSWRPAAGISRLLYRCPVTGESGAVFTPDGKKVRSHACGLEYTMNHASRLIDLHGEEYSVIDLYDQISAMPIARIVGDVILRAEKRNFYRLTRQYSLSALGSGSIELTENEVRYKIGSLKARMPLEAIRSISIEQNHKISFSTERETIQVDLEGLSTLQWQHYIRRLKSNEKPVKHL
ncbi:MAG: lysophospholipid acyltransferase family protein [Cyclonatronaceae bacterium]